MSPGPLQASPEPLQVDTVDVVGVGMIMVDHVYRVPRLPAFGGTLRASGYVRACGGPAANALAGLARLGASTRFVGKTGDDSESDFASAQLAGLGVDLAGLRRTRGTCRRATVLVEEHSGERGLLSWPESFSPLAARDLNSADVAGASVVLIDDADDVGLQVARWARAQGSLVVFDGTWQSEHIEAFLPLVDHAVVSEFFARRFLLPDADNDSDNDAVLDRLLDLGAGTAVVTLGAAGCIARSGTQHLTCPAAPANVIDTTGAGDAFHAGYIRALLDGADLAHRLRFASATAALNCRALGGQQGLPDVPEVEQLLQRTPWPQNA